MNISTRAPAADDPRGNGRRATGDAIVVGLQTPDRLTSLSLRFSGGFGARDYRQSSGGSGGFAGNRSGRNTGGNRGFGGERLAAGSAF